MSSEFKWWSGVFILFGLLIVGSIYSAVEKERHSHELRMACIAAGNQLIEGNCVNGDKSK